MMEVISITGNVITEKENSRTCNYFIQRCVQNLINYLKHEFDTFRNHCYKYIIFFLIILKILVGLSFDGPKDFCFYKYSRSTRILSSQAGPSEKTE